MEKQNQTLNFGIYNRHGKRIFQEDRAKPRGEMGVVVQATRSWSYKACPYQHSMESRPRDIILLEMEGDESVDVVHKICMMWLMRHETTIKVTRFKYARHSYEYDVIKTILVSHRTVKFVETIRKNTHTHTYNEKSVEHISHRARHLSSLDGAHTRCGSA